MINFIFTSSAWAAIVTIVLFISVYSKTYNWYRHRLGLVMNASLISVAIVAIGGIVRSHYELLGTVMASGGWIIFSILLAWRLRLLIESSKEREKELDTDNWN